MSNKSNFGKGPINDDSSYKFKNLIIIVIITCVILVGFYFLTTYVVKNKKDNEVIEPAVIETDNIIFGQLLNRKEDSYYVLAYDDNGKFKQLYDEYINKNSSLKFYKINMNDSFNKNFIGDSNNISDNIKELRIKDETLFKVENKKIKDYYIGSSDIIDELKEISN